MNAPDVLARIAAVAALMAGSREETRFAMLADCFDDLPPEPRRQLLVKLAVREAAGWSTARLAALEARVPGAGFKPDLLIGHPVSRGRWKIDAVFDAKSRSCAGANILLAKTAFPGATRPKDLPQGVHWQWEPDPTGRIRLYVSSNHAYRRSRTWLGSDEIIDGAVVWVFGAVDPAAYAPFVPGWRQVGLESVYALLVALATAHRSASLEGAVGAWVAPAGERPFSAVGADGSHRGSSARFCFGWRGFRGEIDRVRRRGSRSQVCYAGTLGGWVHVRPPMPGGLPVVVTAADRRADPGLAADAAVYAVALVAAGERPSWGPCVWPECQAYGTVGGCLCVDAEGRSTSSGRQQLQILATR
ncbi:hypothetical protein [Klenkia terrae]|uniref:Restriction endonuclease n=1 Tax=Klenkia terrae TaxID=1052259 RepID=A0ABU8EBB0_9ACTN